MRHTFGVFALLLFLAACGPMSAQPTVALGGIHTPTPQPTSYPVTLVCDDCAAAGQQINLWVTADRDGLRIAGSVPSGTAASVVDSTVVDGNTMLQVKAGAIVGWVSDDFAQR